MIKLKHVLIVLIITIFCVGIFSHFFNKAKAVSGDDKILWCQQHSVSQAWFECCISNTLDTIDQCPTNEPEPKPAPEPEYTVPKTTVTPVPAEEAPSASAGISDEVNAKLVGKLDPLWGGLARPFDELALSLPQVMVKKIFDEDNNEIGTADLTNWPEVMPVVKLEIPIEKLEKGKSVNANLPDGLPVKDIIFTAGEDISNSTVSVTITDGSKPKLLKDKDIAPPDPKKYDMKAYITIGAEDNSKNEIHPFSMALFDNPDIYEVGRIVKMFRLNPDLTSWIDLPAAKKDSNCKEGKCEMIAWSPGTSYFALVTEKPTDSMAITLISSFFNEAIYIIIFFVGLIAFVLVVILVKNKPVKIVAVIITVAICVTTFAACGKNILNLLPINYAQVKPLKHLVTLKTTLGDIQFETYDVDAPKSVSSFVTLAESGFYNDNIFHRVIKNFLIQSGDPSGKGNGGPGYIFSEQPDSTTKSNQEGYKRGTVALANEGLWNTNGSQFFIVLSDDANIPNNYTIIGKVIYGSEVMDKIGNLSTGDADRPQDPPKIQSVSVEEVK